jgi:hypothetical protein
MPGHLLRPERLLIELRCFYRALDVEVGHDAAEDLRHGHLRLIGLGRFRSLLCFRHCPSSFSWIDWIAVCRVSWDRTSRTTEAAKFRQRRGVFSTDLLRTSDFRWLRWCPVVSTRHMLPLCGAPQKVPLPRKNHAAGLCGRPEDKL